MSSGRCAQNWAVGPEPGPAPCPCPPALLGVWAPASGLSSSSFSRSLYAWMKSRGLRLRKLMWAFRGGRGPGAAGQWRDSAGLRFQGGLDSGPAQGAGHSSSASWPPG